MAGNMDPLFCRESNSSTGLYIQGCEPAMVRIFGRYACRIYWKKLFRYYAASLSVIRRAKRKAGEAGADNVVHFAEVLRTLQRQKSGFRVASGRNLPQDFRGISVLCVADHEGAGRFAVSYPIPKADVIYIPKNKRLLACDNCPFRGDCFIGS